MPRYSYIVFLSLAQFSVTGCAVTHPRSPEPCHVPRGIVFAADGAGGFLAMSTSLRRTCAAEHVPIAVRTFHWSHGVGRVIADQTDRQHFAVEGRRLAEMVLDCRRHCPERDIYLVGHSAGCGIVLEAANNLPPASVERVILLAPSVCAGYDLRPALRCARCGVDVFHSYRDRVYLLLGTLLLGTVDGSHCCAVAGRLGFHSTSASGDDACLFAKLRQHPWGQSVAWTGNRGGHYGSYQPGFVRAFVVPLLQD